jgi:putative pyruvate formate lyase activating enzyme
MERNGNTDAALRRLDDIFRNCALCPRACGVDRTAGEMGSCGVGPVPLVTSAGPHFGEEPELVGHGGSGTIFFGGCNLHCLFCQNADISQRATGRPAGPEELARLMLTLERNGCENVNLVTPTHLTPPLVRAARLARGMGLRVPLVWNCGGYESREVIELLDGLVEIYMPDFKYGPDAPAGELSGAPNYFEKCSEVFQEMHRQVGVLETDDRGVARRGLLIRHLVLPGGLADSRGVLRFIAELSPESYVNIMDQYRPCHRAGELGGLNRRPTQDELGEVRGYARGLGLHRGF